MPEARFPAGSPQCKVPSRIPHHTGFLFLKQTLQCGKGGRWGHRHVGPSRCTHRNDPQPRTDVPGAGSKAASVEVEPAVPGHPSVVAPCQMPPAFRGLSESHRGARPARPWLRLFPSSICHCALPVQSLLYFSGLCLSISSSLPGDALCPQSKSQPGDPPTRCSGAGPESQATSS